MLGLSLLECRRRLMQNRFGQCGARSQERAAPRRHLVEDASNRPDIGAGVEFVSEQLLWSHVRVSSDWALSFAEALGLGGGTEFATQNHCQTEIQNFESRIGCDANVARLQIAMDHTMLVRDREAFGQLRSEMDDFFFGERP